MKFHPLSIILLAISGCSLPGLAADEQTQPDAQVSTARVLGDIPDGTPPPPAPPKPEFHVAQRDILATTTHEQGGRTITIQQIKPIDLPPPPNPGADAPPAVLSEAFKQRLAEHRALHPRTELLCLGATVYRSATTPPRTLVQYWPSDGGRSISFWSSADFSLIAGGINTFAATNGQTYSLFMSWSFRNLDNEARWVSVRGIRRIAPEIPIFPEGKATFQIIGEQPAAEDLVAIRSLHDLYNSEHDRLLTAYQGREQARLQHEAYLKAHPPQPKDITLSYWRTEKPAPAAAKGGAR